MKVLYIIDSLQGSGAERSLVEIALNFKKYVPVFVHVYKGDMLKPMLQSAGIKMYSLNIPGPRNYSKAAEELEIIYKEEKPDIIHATLYNSEVVARKLRKRYPIPLVGSYVSNSYSKLRLKNHDFSRRMKLLLVQLYDIYSSRNVDFFISNSETIKKEKSKSTWVNPEKVKVIHRGRNMKKYENEFSESELLELRNELQVQGKFIMLSVGRLIKSKGQMDIVDAMPKILEQFPNTVLLLAGHGIFERNLQQRIQELDIEDKVKLLGRRQDVPELLAIADLFVFPTYSEGLPGALIEAMMAGKLILCSDIPENKECVTGGSAILYKRGEVEDLANKIIYIQNAQEEFASLGQEARKIAGEKFDIQKIAQKYEEAYDEYINSFEKTG